MALTIGTVLKKDLLTYSRHKKTLLLIFIAPILIMILIGSIFSGAADKGLTNVKLGVGGDLEYGNQMIEELNNSNMFILIREDTNDSEVIKEGVKRGKYSAGYSFQEMRTKLCGCILIYYSACTIWNFCVKSRDNS